MVKYIAKLNNRPTEILSEREVAEYLHFFTKEEIEYIVEIYRLYKDRISCR